MIDAGLSCETKENVGSLLEVLEMEPFEELEFIGDDYVLKTISLIEIFHLQESSVVKFVSLDSKV